MAKKVNNEKKAVKEKKQNKHFLKDTKAELKKVVWPTPKQLVNNTAAVVAFTLMIALVVFLLDICFESLNKYGITALQEKVRSSYSSEASNETTEENTSTTESTEDTDSNEVVEDGEQTTDVNETNE